MKKTFDKNDDKRFNPGRVPRKEDFEDIDEVAQRFKDNKASPEDIARLVMYTITHKKVPDIGVENNKPQ